MIIAKFILVTAKRFIYIMRNLNLLGHEANHFNGVSILGSFYNDDSNFSNYLLQQLQTTLDIDKLLAIFSSEASRFVDFCGLSLSTDSKIQHIKNSRKGKIQYRYKIDVEGKTVAILCYSTNSTFDGESEKKLHKMHATLRYPLRNALMFQETLQQALNDSLTGLGNRRQFDQQSARAINQANRRQSKVSVMLFDLNKFKKINDTYGHHVGDSVLARFAVALEQSVRDSDSVFRLGGDEFAVLVEDSCENSINAIENRLQKNISADTILKKYNVHFACGHSTLNAKDSIDSMLIRADKKLYQDKFTESKVANYS